MSKTRLLNETPAEQISRWIREHNGSERDALNVALARLEELEWKLVIFKQQLDEEREEQP